MLSNLLQDPAITSAKILLETKYAEKVKFYLLLSFQVCLASRELHMIYIYIYMPLRPLFPNKEALGILIVMISHRSSQGPIILVICLPWC